MLEKTPHSDVADDGSTGSDTGPSGAAKNQRGRVTSGLSGRLLVLTIVFVMIAEILIFVPSVANFRNVWLQNHLDTAESASIVYLDSADVMLSEEAQAQLLKATESLSVAIRDGDVSRLMAASPIKQPVDEMIDLSVMQPVESLRSTLSTLFFGGERVYQVSGPMKSRDGAIALVQMDNYLRDALLIFSRNILLLSLAISLITAGLVYMALYWMIVRPIIRLSSNMDAFSHSPETPGLVLTPSGRTDEIGLAEERLAALQSDLQATLRQKQHLAELGLAVSKINHDLRNILASALLFTDRLTAISDPTVQKFAPKLVNTIERAVDYTRSVLAYGRARESAPEIRRHNLARIIDDVGDILGIANSSRIDWQNDVPSALEIDCDSEQLFRAILNLSRNAVQAMEAKPEGFGGSLKIDAKHENGSIAIRVTDTGPGIPEEKQQSLFSAFQTSSKSGGTGLGLAIASELIRAHDGELQLERSDHSGSCFLIRLPVRSSPTE